MAPKQGDLHCSFLTCHIPKVTILLISIQLGKTIPPTNLYLISQGQSWYCNWLAEILLIITLDVTEPESWRLFLIIIHIHCLKHCFNWQAMFLAVWNHATRLNTNLTLFLEIIHCMCILLVYSRRLRSFSELNIGS